MLENIMFNIKAIAAVMGISTDKLAEKAGIDCNHLKQVWFHVEELE